ncbi:MAG: MBL fold metallo-hydrolase [Acidobacteria bacterium]|nr:MBL fold metallo-hydrolase [Acidobacteriota bacterium]
MMIVKSLNRSIVFAVFLLSALPLLGQGQRDADFTPSLIEIVEGVYAYEGGLQLGGEEGILRVNSLVVVTDAGILIADGQPTPEDGRKMLNEIRKVTRQPVRFVVNSSPHGDHTGSNSSFPNAVILSHVNARSAMAESRERLSDKNTQARLPEAVYNERMTVHLGDKRIELLYFGRGHTEGDTVVFLPDEGVAFLSELYFNDVFASLAEGYASEHLDTLSEIMKLEATWFLPGHGLISGQSREQLRTGLDRFYQNVKAIDNVVRQHVRQGDSLETTLARADEELGEFSRLPFYGYLKERTITGVFQALSKNR